MKITVCIGSSCHLKGSRQVVEKLQKLVDEHNLKDKIILCGTFCMGNCQKGVCCTLDGKPYSLNEDNTEEFIFSEVLPNI